VIERIFWLIIVLVLSVFAVTAHGQSSSLYIDAPPAPSITRQNNGGVRPDRLSPAIAAASFSAVNPPEQRFFATHDLITIIVRESTDASSEASLETKRNASLNAGVEAWPGVRGIDELWNLFVKTDLTANPRVSTNFRNNWKGEGDYERRDRFTTRLTARVIDVKPNGTLVLEARKYVRSDREELDMVLSGVCRAEDVKADNTVLSTQLYDLRLNKQHRGEVRGASKKGFITKIFESLFAF
jgi:flagellar L-ring protein precursor FlgH